MRRSIALLSFVIFLVCQGILMSLQSDFGRAWADLQPIPGFYCPSQSVLDFSPNPNFCYSMYQEFGTYGSPGNELWPKGTVPNTGSSDPDATARKLQRNDQIMNDFNQIGDDHNKAHIVEPFWIGSGLVLLYGIVSSPPIRKIIVSVTYRIRRRIEFERE